MVYFSTFKESEEYQGVTVFVFYLTCTFNSGRETNIVSVSDALDYSCLHLIPLVLLTGVEGQ